MDHIPHPPRKPRPDGPKRIIPSVKAALGPRLDSLRDIRTQLSMSVPGKQGNGDQTPVARHQPQLPPKRPLNVSHVSGPIVGPSMLDVGLAGEQCLEHGYRLLQSLRSTPPCTQVYVAISMDELEWGQYCKCEVRITQKNMLSHAALDFLLNQTEARRLASAHPGITRLHTYFHTAEFIFVVTDYQALGDVKSQLASSSSRQRCQQQQQPTSNNKLVSVDRPPCGTATVCGSQGGGAHCDLSQGGWDESMARRIFSQLVHAVMICHHNNLILPNLHWENVFCEESSGCPLKITEVNLMESECNWLESLHDYVTVSPPAPEISTSKFVPLIISAVDMWNLGVILHAMLSGRLPVMTKRELSNYDQAHPNLFLPTTLSPAVPELVKGLLHYDATKRLSLEEVIKHPWLNDADDFTQLEFEVSDDEEDEEEEEQSVDQSVDAGTDGARARLVRRPQLETHNMTHAPKTAKQDGPNAYLRYGEQQ